jgi:hypothetical protein
VEFIAVEQDPAEVGQSVAAGVEGETLLFVGRGVALPDDLAESAHLPLGIAAFA